MVHASSSSSVFIRLPQAPHFEGMSIRERPQFQGKWKGEGMCSIQGSSLKRGSLWIEHHNPVSNLATGPRSWEVLLCLSPMKEYAQGQRSFHYSIWYINVMVLGRQILIPNNLALRLATSLWEADRSPASESRRRSPLNKSAIALDVIFKDVKKHYSNYTAEFFPREELLQRTTTDESCARYFLEILEVMVIWIRHSKTLRMRQEHRSG